MKSKTTGTIRAFNRFPSASITARQTDVQCGTITLPEVEGDQQQEEEQQQEETDSGVIDFFVDDVTVQTRSPEPGSTVTVQVVGRSVTAVEEPTAGNPTFRQEESCSTFDVTVNGSPAGSVELCATTDGTVRETVEVSIPDADSAEVCVGPVCDVVQVAQPQQQPSETDGSDRDVGADELPAGGLGIGALALLLVVLFLAGGG